MNLSGWGHSPAEGSFKLGNRPLGFKHALLFFGNWTNISFSKKGLYPKEQVR
jgi:hypothetical protein